MRKKIVAGNWKMNTSLNEGTGLAKDVASNAATGLPEGVSLIIAPPFTHLMTIREILPAGIGLSAQNCASENSGAFTGEVSAAMIASAGAEYVIIGHSERRSLFNETDEELNRKVSIALENNLKPIFCCGENLEERDKNIHKDVVKKQIVSGLKGISRDDFSDIIIAYEPVWAIGTGKTATPEQAQEMHLFIRNLLRELYDESAADQAVILYGGSCKPSNAKEIFSKEDVDGGLIGGASLKAEDFLAIARSF
ncbi:MAG: triose-phosphate isomerase [Marinilabiliales bacterium]|nr:MAG: triose-phosphate isomerase [Marinilabiliales bacterium]